MTAITNLDTIINGLSVNNYGQRLFFNKLATNSAVARTAQTMWLATGLPSAGTTPTVGMAGAVTCDSTTAGALKFTNGSGGRSTYLLYLSALMNAGARGELILVDRLAHANISNDQATAAFSPVIDGTARLAAGEGAQIIMEVTSNLSGGSNTRTFTYSNQAGTGSRTTQSIATVSSAQTTRAPYTNYVFVPLQDGDTGVRTITDTTLSAGTATGAYNVVLVKVLAKIPVIGFTLSEKDTVVNLPSLPQIADSACLSLYFVPANNATTTRLLGEVRIIEN